MSFAFRARLILHVQDDLEAFHLKHFGTASKNLNQDSHPQAQTKEVHQENDLGYYADGVKRTLTDEQIAMFRHGEIRKLLRERASQQQPAETKQIPEQAARLQPGTVAPRRASGSAEKTHRRIARELDEVKADNIELDY